MSFIVQEVFVQCSWVSCHCGRQCTVVQRRICYFSIRDLQAHKIVVFINCRCETIRKRVTCVSMWINISKELWFGSWILTIPVQVSYSSIIFTGQSDFFSHRFKCLVFQRCYWLRKCLLCKTTIKLFIRLTQRIHINILQHYNEISIQQHKKNEIKHPNTV